MAQDDLQYWADHLTVSTGKTWTKQIKSLHICWDASCVGYGAYMLNDVQQGTAWGAQKLSSVLLETKNARLARQSVVYNIDPVKLSGVVIVLTGDCLPSIQGLLKMGGPLLFFLRSNICICSQLIMMCK